MKVGEGTITLWTVDIDPTTGGTYTTKEEAIEEVKQYFYNGKIPAEDLYTAFNDYIDFDWNTLLVWAMKQENFRVAFAEEIEKAANEYAEARIERTDI